MLIFLFFSALLYVVFGAYSLWSPLHMLASMQIEVLASPAAFFEFRPLYGVFNLCVGLLGLSSLKYSSLRFSYLLFLCILNGSYAFGRAISFFVDTSPPTDLLFVWLFESLVLTLSIFFLRQQVRTADC